MHFVTLLVVFMRHAGCQDSRAFPFSLVRCLLVDKDSCKDKIMGTLSLGNGTAAYMWGLLHNLF